MGSEVSRSVRNYVIPVDGYRERQSRRKISIKN